MGGDGGGGWSSQRLQHPDQVVTGNSLGPGSRCRHCDQDGDPNRVMRSSPVPWQNPPPLRVPRSALRVQWNPPVLEPISKREERGRETRLFFLRDGSGWPCPAGPFGIT